MYMWKWQYKNPEWNLDSISVTLGRWCPVNLISAALLSNYNFETRACWEQESGHVETDTLKCEIRHVRIIICNICGQSLQQSKLKKWLFFSGNVGIILLFWNIQNIWLYECWKRNTISIKYGLINFIFSDSCNYNMDVKDSKASFCPSLADCATWPRPPCNVFLPFSPDFQETVKLKLTDWIKNQRSQLCSLFCWLFY